MSLITISRCLGSGGRDIAFQVAKELNIEVYDDNRLQQIAVDMGIHEAEFKNLDVKMPGLFDRIWSHKPEFFQDIMEAVVYEVSRNGKGVILGHGSQFLLHDFGCALHVFLHSSEEKRIKRICHIFRMTERSARTFIKRRDNEKNEHSTIHSCYCKLFYVDLRRTGRTHRNISTAYPDHVPGINACSGNSDPDKRGGEGFCRGAVAKN